LNRLLIIGIFILSPSLLSWAQKFTPRELIEKWKIATIHQTIEAEKTYTDLKYHLVPTKFQQTIQELNEYLSHKPDDRLKIRIKMYEIIGNMEMKSNVPYNTKEEIFQLFKIALPLKDPQLLSELYSLYAERNFESIDNRVFYLNRAIEIQEGIGKEYFPKFYLRKFLTASSYFNIYDYKEATKNGKDCLELMKKPEVNLQIYILTLDMLGTIYFRENKLDSSIYYYQEIHASLKDYRSNFKKYEENFNKFYEDYYGLWKGIADGGIARAYLEKGQIDDALPLIQNNLNFSTQFKEKNDIAKAQNLMGKYLEEKNENYKAIQIRRKAYQNAVESQTHHEIIQACLALDQLYKSIKKYDSAYFFNDKKYLTQLQINESISESKIHTIGHKMQHDKLIRLFNEAEQTIKQERITRNFIILGIILLLLFLLYLYKRREFKQKLKYLELERNKEITELKLQKSEEDMRDAHEQLDLFKLKLQHNQILLDSIRTGHATKSTEFPELQSLTILTKEDWTNFKKQFDKVNPHYIYNLRDKYPQITEAELRYLCLVKLNLRQNEIASALGVSESSIRVTWHRMRKKFQVEKDLNPIEFLKYFESNS
jgi:DNA-binding CsgD family transcriptional regulator